MCKKAMYAAIRKVESDLANDEKIIWSGIPDRKIICNKINTFYWKNVVFFLALAGLAVTTLFISPAQSKSIFILLGAIGLVRLVGTFFARSTRKKRINMAYALTNKRLISVNGLNEEMACWYSPSIESLRTAKNGHTRTFKLRDNDLNFTMELFYIADHAQLKALLTPYIATDLKTRQDNVALPDSSATPMAKSQEEDPGLMAKAA